MPPEERTKVQGSNASPSAADNGRAKQDAAETDAWGSAIASAKVPSISLAIWREAQSGLKSVSMRAYPKPPSGPIGAGFADRAWR
jgi:hypothetical protein